MLATSLEAELDAHDAKNTKQAKAKKASSSLAYHGVSFNNGQKHGKGLKNFFNLGGKLAASPQPSPLSGSSTPIFSTKPVALGSSPSSNDHLSDSDTTPSSEPREYIHAHHSVVIGTSSPHASLHSLGAPSSPLSVPVSFRRPSENPSLYRSASQQTFGSVSSCRSLPRSTSASSSPPGPKTPTSAVWQPNDRAGLPNMSILRSASSIVLRGADGRDCDFGQVLDVASSMWSSSSIDDSSDSPPHSAGLPPFTPAATPFVRRENDHPREEDEDEYVDAEGDDPPTGSFAPVRIKIAGREEYVQHLKPLSQASFGSGSGFGSINSPLVGDDRASVHSSSRFSHRSASSGPRTVVVFLKGFGSSSKAMVERLALLPRHRLEDAHIRVVLVVAGDPRQIGRFTSSLKVPCPFSIFTDATTALFSAFSLNPPTPLDISSHADSSTFDPTPGLHTTPPANPKASHKHIHFAALDHVIHAVKEFGSHHAHGGLGSGLGEVQTGVFVLLHSRMGPRCIFASRHPTPLQGTKDIEDAIEAAFHGAGLTTIKTAASVVDELGS